MHFRPALFLSLISLTLMTTVLGVDVCRQYDITSRTVHVAASESKGWSLLPYPLPGPASQRIWMDSTSGLAGKSTFQGGKMSLSNAGQPNGETLLFRIESKGRPIRYFWLNSASLCQSDTRIQDDQVTGIQLFKVVKGGGVVLQ
jgi:hypothetical protein